MSPEVTCTWAGRPSRIATSAGPWDSPAVSQRSMAQVFHAATSRRPQRPGAETSGRSVAESRRDPGSDRDGEHRGDQHEGAEREALAVDDPQQAQEGAPEATDEEGAVDPGRQLRPADVAERHAKDAR